MAKRKTDKTDQTQTEITEESEFFDTDGNEIDDDFMSEIMDTEAPEVHPGGKVFLRLAGFRKDEDTGGEVISWKNEKGTGKYYSPFFEILEDEDQEESEYSLVGLFLTIPDKNKHSGNGNQARNTRYNFANFCKAFDIKSQKEITEENLKGMIKQAIINKKFNKTMEQDENVIKQWL